MTAENTQPLVVDLNCDMGESFGPWVMGNDSAVLPLISSANIACGFHAGDPSIMRATVAGAIKNNVAIGAHPGLPDLQGFGRRSMNVSPQQVYDMVVVQVGALSAIAGIQGAKINHVKAHGALYNMAASNIDIATAIAQAVYDINPKLILFGLAGSAQVTAGNRLGLHVSQEVFVDRTYQDNGTLTARNQLNAMITDPKIAIAQAIQMVKSGTVTSVSGKTIKVQADTICLHGDQPNAVQFAQEINSVFNEQGIKILAPQIN